MVQLSPLDRYQQSSWDPHGFSSIGLVLHVEAQRRNKSTCMPRATIPAAPKIPGHTPGPERRAPSLLPKGWK